jgi:hypothetical protein
VVVRSPVSRGDRARKQRVRLHALPDRTREQQDARAAPVGLPAGNRIE